MITSLYAGLLGLFFFRISMDTINARRSRKVSLGTGGDDEVEKYVSAHANFVAYALYLLFLLFLAERSNLISPYLIHLIALSFTAGRVFHYLALKQDKMDFKKRILGMRLTLFPLIFLSVINIYIFMAMRFGWSF